MAGTRMSRAPARPVSHRPTTRRAMATATTSPPPPARSGWTGRVEALESEMPEHCGNRDAHGLGPLRRTVADLQTALDALDGRLTALDAADQAGDRTVAQRLDGHDQALTSLGSTVAEVAAGLRHDLGGLSDQVAALRQVLGTTSAAVTTEARTRADADAALSSRIDTLVTAVGTVTGRVDSLTGQVDGLAGSLSTLGGTVTALSDRLDTLTARAPRWAASVVLLPALVAGAAKDVDALWDTLPPTAPALVRVTSVEGVTALIDVTVKSASKDKAVLTVKAPLAVGAGVARVRLLAEWVA